jgi:hypothetical protein
MNAKKLVLLLLLNICIFDLYASKPEHVNGDVILIRYFSPLTNSIKSSIKIYKNNNEIEDLVLPATTNTDENNSFMEVRNKLQKYISEGYSIISSTATAQGNTHIYIYILEKK